MYELIWRDTLIPDNMSSENHIPDAPVRLSGLQKLCKLYGRMKCGDTMMVWDYANNITLPEAELRKDKARWAASERAKYGVLLNDRIGHAQK